MWEYFNTTTSGLNTGHIQKGEKITSTAVNILNMELFGYEIKTALSDNMWYRV